MRCGREVVVCLAALALCPSALPQTPAPARVDLDFFEAKVRPLLVNRCFACHSTQAKKTRGGLDLDSRTTILKGGDTGPAAVAGDPAKSLLVHAISYHDGELSMPPQGKLPEHEVAVLVEWVRRGLPYPEARPSQAARTTIDIDAGRTFWSFQPLKTAAPPVVKNSAWLRRPIDAFILAELEKRGLATSAAAEPRVLIRRLYFDLIGLPPTPGAVDEFVAAWGESAKPQAVVEREVDRLLESPHYGERWARYWLDLARYCDVPEQWAETKGKPYLYRDWVVRALNDDVPYDEFVVKQLAADLLPDATPADRAALGFLGLSPSYWKELKLAPDVIKTVVAEEWEERIHTVTSTFLGLTVGCARCHDHKFDPITVQDYYGLAGVFASTKIGDQPVTDLRTLVGDFRLPPLAVSPFDVALQVHRSNLPAPKTPPLLASGVQEASLHVLPDGPHKTKLVYKPAEPIDVAVQIRGNPSNLGPVVPRRFLAVLSPGEPKPFRQGSGRLELARAIVADAAPLAARVIVNRVWKHHFGAGLVETPSDFGSQGERPSHPALLDDLAARFVRNGWSLKWLHREIVLSATYQQASAPFSPGSKNRAGGSPANGENPGSATSARFSEPGLNDASSVDPDNRLLWRMNARRLDVEAWRDAMLAVSGNLDPRLGGPPTELHDPNNRRRTLYGTVKRRELSDLLRLHDFPDPTTHSAARVPTTTPLQQLFTLNSPLLQQQAAALLKRLHAEAPQGERQRIARAYWLLFGRVPSERETKLGLDFLGPQPTAHWPAYAQVLLGSNEFLFVD